MGNNSRETHVANHGRKVDPLNSDSFIPLSRTRTMCILAWLVHGVPRIASMLLTMSPRAREPRGMSTRVDCCNRRLWMHQPQQW